MKPYPAQKRREALIRALEGMRHLVRELPVRRLSFSLNTDLCAVLSSSAGRLTGRPSEAAPIRTTIPEIYLNYFKKYIEIHHFSYIFPYMFNIHTTTNLLS